MKKTYFEESQRLRRRIESMLPDFYDMIFYEGTDTAEIMSHYKNSSAGAVLPSCFGYGFTFDICKIEAADLTGTGAAGRFWWSPEKGGHFKIEIGLQYLEDDAIIEHEMIHFFEEILNEIPSCYRDIVLICLYNRVNKMIPGLEDLLKAEARRDNTRALLNDDTHGILFYLKSLELDVIHDRKLGTTRSYHIDNAIETIQFYQDLKEATGYNYTALR